MAQPTTDTALDCAQPMPDGPYIPTAAAAFRQLYQRMQGQDCYSVLLHSAGGPQALNGWSFIGLYPRQTLSLSGQTLTHTQHKAESTPPHAHTTHHPNWASLSQALDAATQQCHVWPEQTETGLPFTGGWFGVIGYPFYAWCEEIHHKQAASQTSDFPSLSLTEFEDVLLFNHTNERLHVLSDSAERQQEYEEEWQTCLKETARVKAALPISQSISPEDLTSFETALSSTEYEKRVATLLEAITEGEIYQANLTLRLQKQMALSPLQVFETLCQRNPSPFCGIYQTPAHLLICNSPERLVQQNLHGTLETRPIAGTRGRGATQAEDKALGLSLQQDEKERAEHLMLVDLLRNDMGRVSIGGSVQVSEQLVLERYSHVTHLVSNIISTKKQEANPWDVIRSLFPGGTITGCPKIRCIDILENIEPVPRGWYTGSLGYLDARTGQMDWNILIRSLFLTPHPSNEKTADLNAISSYNVAVHVGAGIVADSVGAFEYKESLRKATASITALSPQSGESPS